MKTTKKTVEVLNHECETCDRKFSEAKSDNPFDPELGINSGFSYRLIPSASDVTIVRVCRECLDRVGVTKSVSELSQDILKVIFEEFEAPQPGKPIGVSQVESSDS